MSYSALSGQPGTPPPSFSTRSDLGSQKVQYFVGEHELQGLRSTTNSTSASGRFPGPDDEAASTVDITPAAYQNEKSRRSATSISLQSLKRSIPHWSDSWSYEIVMITISLLSTLAIVILLDKISNRPLSTWTFFLKPNSLIAILATLTHATMLLPLASCLSQLKWLHFAVPDTLDRLELFDSASRGPYGAVQLLFALKLRRKSALASIGALITILALAIDPFAQEVLAFPSRETATGTAVYSISNEFGGGQTFGIPNAFLGMGTELRIQGAVFNALFGLHSPPVFECATGHCSWGDFVSLGVASQCDDLTESTQVSCTAPRDIPEGEGLERNCTYSDASSQLKGVETLGYNHTAQYMSTGTAMNSTGFLNTSDPTNIANFYAVQFPVAASLEAPTVTKCSLSLVAKKFLSAQVTNGSFSFSSIEDMPLILDTSLPPLDMTTGIVSLIFHPLTSNATSFHINQMTLGQLSALLTSLFTTSLYRNSEGSVIDTITSAPGSTTQEGDLAFMQQPLNLGIALLGTDLHAVAARIADSLTEVIRTGAGSRRAEGKAWEKVTYMEVRWEWIVFPIVLLVLATGLLAASMVVSRKEGGALWKTSSLALLFHGVEGWREEELGSGRSSDVQGLARGMVVRRATVDGGGDGDGEGRLRFVKADGV
ncbi:hypothetical protein K402DRAFT_167875 [Aulographum hederae CBS 113979]|uniref:Uncharacterized protein n=1 Tax=Aulographum hederae CBS 113979 TaxID=1176131 RepID=A0A6G1HCK9_9PEZI|nr:hypothetical protein K402DRAFT_167875 [Aulographum hederae CBS 113979]